MTCSVLSCWGVGPRAGRAIALAALLCCLASCSTATDGSPAPPPGTATAELRDGAVRAAEQAAVVLTSLDQRSAEAGYDKLLALLTGPARQEWAQRRADHLAPTTSGVLRAQG
ncbi:MAG TPA: hypothetical protein VFQ77_11210, partial [Pseudonocardiaceae bacterium]|nr:hypothetical protein [Pseudonocardiaceae bacterium]